MSGNISGTISDHELTLYADAYTPVNDTLIPTGELLPVAGTAFDFRKAKSIGHDINAEDPQLKLAGGYDHNFVLNKPKGEYATAAVLHHPASGRVIELKTTEPGLQFYSGNGLDGTLKGKGATYGPRSGVCLEPQYFPDSPNQPRFPSTILNPGETYRSQMGLLFSVR